MIHPRYHCKLPYRDILRNPRWVYSFRPRLHYSSYQSDCNADWTDEKKSQISATRQCLNLRKSPEKNYHKGLEKPLFANALASAEKPAVSFIELKKEDSQPTCFCNQHKKLKWLNFYVLLFVTVFISLVNMLHAPSLSHIIHCGVDHKLRNGKNFISTPVWC